MSSQDPRSDPVDDGVEDGAVDDDEVALVELALQLDESSLFGARGLRLLVLLLAWIRHRGQLAASSSTISASTTSSSSGGGVEPELVRPSL